MDEQELAQVGRARSRKFWSAIALAVLGAVGVAVGFAVGQGRSGDEATGWGVMAGAGLIFMLSGVLVAWMTRPGNRRWMTEGPQTKRDRLQAQRSYQLFLFPLVAVIFLIVAIEPLRRLVAGEGHLRDYLSVLLPVLYAWVTAAVAMGWDGHSRQNRRYLEDELTVVIRARAMTTAFLVLMGGVTATLAVVLVRPEFGAIALLASLAAAGATAGVRFAWLDREAGRDG